LNRVCANVEASLFVKFSTRALSAIQIDIYKN